MVKIAEPVFIGDYEEVCREFAGETELSIDLETSGLDPMTSRIAVITLHAPRLGKSAIIHNRGLMPERLRQFLSAPHVRWTHHNGTAFDLILLALAGVDVYAGRQYDTMVGELVTLASGRKDVSVSLKATTQRRLHKADKRTIDHGGWMNEHLSREQEEYCLGDIGQLAQLRQVQCEKVAGTPQERELELEMELVPVSVAMTLNGLPIRRTSLEHYTDLMHTDRLVAQNWLYEKFGHINLRSPVQVKSAFREAGLGILSTNYETMRDLELRGSEHAAQLLRYRHADQRVKMYSDEWVRDHALPDTEGSLWVHARFWQVGTDTGRFSSSDPNLQQVPRDMRWVFEGPPGYRMVSVDYCLHPDTLISTVVGSKRIADIVPGDLVYSLRNGRIAVNPVTASASIRVLPAYRLTFDNGESVTASSDHRWPVQDGSETGVRSTADLRTGDKMVPIRRASAGTKRYSTLYTRSSFDYVYEHQIIAEAVLGPCPPEHQVHHKDENHLNNAPDNLEYRAETAHKREHGYANYAKQDHALRRQWNLESIATRRSYTGQGNPNYGKVYVEQRQCIVCDTPTQRRDPMGRGPWPKYCSTKCQQDAYHGRINHKLVAKEYVGLQPMHAITVANDHNYALACGVITQNSQLEVRWAAEISKDAALLEAFAVGGDSHRQIASQVFQRAPELITTEERRTSKDMVFCLLFAGGANTLYEYARRAGSHMTEQDARALVTRFFTTYRGLSAMRDRAIYLANQRRPVTITMPTGLRRVLVGPSLRPTVILNTMIQGSAASGIKYGMLEAKRRGLHRRGLGAQVHDELVACVREDEAIEYAAELRECMLVGMQRAMSVCPIDATVKVGSSWNDEGIPGSRQESPRPR